MRSNNLEKENHQVKVTVFDYDDNNYAEKEIPLNECVAYKIKPTVTWINIDGIHNKEAVKNICDCFGINNIVYEQIVDNRQKPRIEDHDDYIFIILKMYFYNRKSSSIVSEQVSVILGANYVLTFQEMSYPGDVFDPVRKRIRTAGTKIRKSKADYLLYRLLDAIIDYYFVVLEELGEHIENIEQETITAPGKSTLVRMQRFRKEMLYLRKSVWPVREIMNSLQRGESNLISDEIEKNMRELYEHTIQIIDTFETLRDTMSSLLDIYLSSISNRLNEVMKMLTMISTIFMPLTFIAGIYGMNFKYMPELDWKYGYLMVWGSILLIVSAMFVYFKKKKWL